jgi:hypothetical protein
VAKIAASDLERRLRKTIRGDMGGETVSDSGVKLSLVIFVVSGAAAAGDGHLVVG